MSALFRLILLLAAVCCHGLKRDLFVPSPRYPCFRQPAILATSTGAILAFAENRNVSACAPAARVAAASGPQPNEIGSLVLRRSTDGGTTWDPLEVIYTVSSSPGIDFYVVLSDARKGRTAGEVLWLFLQVGFDTLVLTSHDDGTTWDAPRSLSSWNATLPYPLKNPRPSVGHGIQLSGSGRLVVPMVCVNASASGSHGDRGCTTCNACLL